MDNIFADFVLGHELYVNEDEWGEIINTHPKEFVIEQMSDAIRDFDIALPYRHIGLDDVEAEYKTLCNIKEEDLSNFSSWYSKFDYDFDYLPHYIGISNVGNKASDYFHQVERWKCDATGYPSPQKTWENERFRLTLFKALYSLKVTEITPQVFRHLISLRKYIAAQFRPSAAKYIYDFFKPEVTLDFSMGWGDRILGAHASKYVKKYIGFDPNINLTQGYINQIQYYNSIGDIMEFSLYPNCAESLQISVPDKVDLVFTSPPYFDKEKYDQSDNQSYKKYKEFNSWLENFLFKSIELRTENLKRGGYLAINISDIYTRKKHFQICNAMNEYIASTRKFEYYGAIGLRMPKRPMSKSANVEGVYAEPIWIWRKK